MKRMLFVLLTWPACLASAQTVPGADLMRFPIGYLDRPAALRSDLGADLGNPANVSFIDSARARLGVAAIQTPSDQGVSAHLLAMSVSLRGQLAAGLTVARITVDDLFRTDTDPQTFGRQIPYGTTMYSATIARRNAGNFSAGLAARYRRGELDNERSGAFGLDAGLLAEHMSVRDASAGLATFLFRPGGDKDEPPTVNVAVDARALGRDEKHQVRAGLAVSIIDRARRERFLFGSARYGIWEGRAGIARADAFGVQEWRGRLGFLLRYGRYVVGFAREENGAGLSPNYQFTLNTIIR